MDGIFAAVADSDALEEMFACSVLSSRGLCKCMRRMLSEALSLLQKMEVLF